MPVTIQNPHLLQGVKEQVLLQIFQSYDVNGDQARCKAGGKVEQPDVCCKNSRSVL